MIYRTTRRSTSPRPAPPLNFLPRRRSIVSIDPCPCDLTDLHTRYLNPGELERLITLIASSNPRCVIEIGTNSGRTAKAILRNVPGVARYVGIDVPSSYVTGKQVQRREVLPNPGELALDDPRFRLLVTRRGSLDLTADDLPICDAIFIDGDHSAEAVRHDYALAQQLVRRGGIIVFHDDHGDDIVDVSATLDALAAAGAPIVHVEGTWLAFQRV